MECYVEINRNIALAYFIKKVNPGLLNSKLPLKFKGDLDKL